MTKPTIMSMPFQTEVHLDDVENAQRNEKIEVSNEEPGSETGGAKSGVRTTAYIKVYVRVYMRACAEKRGSSQAEQNSTRQHLSSIDKYCTTVIICRYLRTTP